MGAVLAKFRKEKSTYEILENLEVNIKEIEEYSISTAAKQKRFVGTFLAISIGLYVIGFLVFYFAFFPPTWKARMTNSIPLLIFPLIIILLRRLLAWCFQRKLNKNSSKLSELRAEKRKVLEKVMDKETYKVAIELLTRFGDKSTTARQLAVTPRITKTPATPAPPKVQIGTAHQPQPVQNSTDRELATMPDMRLRRTSPNTPRTSSTRSALTSPFRQNQDGTQIKKLRTPFPIINQQEKGALEKMVDYLIGDGIQNRFAMICKECYGHNGMVLQEEYEYATFRCAFCSALNPSRKSRPIAPKLPTMSPTRLPSPALMSATKRGRDSDSSTSDSEKYSDTDSDTKSKQSVVKRVVFLAETEHVESISAAVDDTDSAPAEETPKTEEEESAKPNVEKKND